MTMRYAHVSNGLVEVAAEKISSKLVIETILGNPVSDGGPSSPTIHDLLAAHQEILREILILGAIARDNMEQRDDGERFDAIAKKTEARLNSL